MAQSHPRDLTLSRNVLRTLLVLNPVFGFLILAMLIATFAAEGFMMRALIHEHGTTYSAESDALGLGMRSIMLLGTIAAVLVQVALRKLLSIVETCLLYTSDAA